MSETPRAPSLRKKFYDAARASVYGREWRGVMIFAGTPAYDAGLDAGGQIAALDSFRVTRDTFDRRLQELRPGDSITRALFRDDELRASNVKLGDQTEGAYRIPPHTNRPPAAPVLR